MTTPIERPFGFWTASALVVGGMIGAGIFVLPAQVAPFGFTGVVAWIIAIAGAMLLAWVTTGLSKARPDATGLIAITGDALGPLAGVLNGWAYWISVWVSTTVLGMSAANYLSAFVPILNATPLYLAFSSIAFLWLITLLNLTGARSVGAFQLATTLLKLLPLLAVALILAGLLGKGSSAFTAHPHAGFSGNELSSAVNLVFMALLGFEAAGIAAQRVRDPARNLTRATLAGLALTGALYLIVSTGVVYALPTEQLTQSAAPLALFVSSFLGNGAGLIIAAFAAISAIGCLNGWVLVQGEVPLGMARSGLLPKWIGRTDRRDVPVTMILLSSSLASVLLLLGASNATANLFQFMLRLTTTVALFNYAAFCIAAWVMGVRRGAALVGLAFSLWTIWGAGLEVSGLGILLMLTAIPLYWLRPRTAVSAPQPAE